MPVLRNDQGTVLISYNWLFKQFFQSRKEKRIFQQSPIVAEQINIADRTELGEDYQLFILNFL